MKKTVKTEFSEYKNSRMRRAEAKNGILFVLPWIIGFLGFTLYPILSSLYYSFCDYSVIKEPVFTGVKNYVTLFHDQTFIKACKNTAYMMLIGVPVTTFFAVAVSVILNSKKLRHTGWMRVVFFIPTLVPTVVACPALDLGYAARNWSCQYAIRIYRY